jgi:outer membrane receptor protein involved in Fe transport
MQYNPRWHAKASLSYERGQFGGRIAARSVSSVYSSQGGTFGLVEHDSYSVTDLSAYVYLDESRRQQVVFRVENAFDETYATLRGFRTGSYDDGSGSFLSMLQGLPRTYRISYRYRI